jgi:hypothetical protein
MAKINADPDWKSNLPKQALNSVSLNNQRIIKGSDEAIINPAYDAVSDDDIFDFVSELMTSRDELTPTLEKIEESNLSKLGPRSFAKPWEERKGSLYKYFENKDFTHSGLSVKSGGRLRPATRQTAINTLLRSSSSGLPDLIRKGAAIDGGLLDLSEPGEYPCVLYTRTQEQRKTRDVWGYPVADTVWEQEFYLPFQGLEKTMSSRKALLGPDQVDSAVTDLFVKKRPEDVIVCVDFSSYDSSIHPRLVHRAFSYMAEFFQTQYTDDLYELFKRFISIPIYTPDGEVSGYHGVPSGSSFTNTIDSLIQLMVAGTWERCQVQGDDGVYLVRNRDVDLFLSRFEQDGLTINDDKTDRFTGHEAVYLQRYYHPKYAGTEGGLGGVYSIARALNRIKYLERWSFDKRDISGSDFFALRTIMILENCKHHPYYIDLVKFAHRHDEFGLNYSYQGLKAYSNLLESKVRAGVINQYGEKSGIESFQTVKILKTL